MEILLLIIGIVAGMLILFRPVPRPQIIYLPIEIVQERDRKGCLPLIIVTALILVVLVLSQATL